MISDFADCANADRENLIMQTSDEPEGQRNTYTLIIAAVK